MTPQGRGSAPEVLAPEGPPPPVSPDAFRGVSPGAAGPVVGPSVTRKEEAMAERKRWTLTGPAPFGWTSEGRGQVTVTLAGPSDDGSPSDMAERVLRDLNAAPALAEENARLLEVLERLEQRTIAYVGGFGGDSRLSNLRYALEEARAALAASKGGAA